jgi:hypothetical protein
MTPGPALTAVCVALVLCAPAAGGFEDPTTRPAEHPRIVLYAPGVRIDWERLLVEVDAHVVLRRGPLELFACAPNTREHESIVAVAARPQRIYEALGLIGLEPGSPVRYDAATERFLPATGPRLRIDVSVRGMAGTRTCGIHEWMRRIGDRDALKPCDWVYAGGRRLPDGRLASDFEGTVICVVDFSSALIALPELHSSANVALWLEANTERIPAMRTPCVLRISAARRGRAVLRVDAEGRLRMDGDPVTPEQMVQRLRQAIGQDPGAHVILLPDDLAARAQAAALRDRLAKQGLDVRMSEPPPPPAAAPDAKDPAP